MMNIQLEPMTKTKIVDTVCYVLYYNADAMAGDQSGNKSISKMSKKNNNILNLNLVVV